MLGYSDIAHAHEKLDGAMNVTDVSEITGDSEQTMRETFAGFGVDFDAVKSLGSEYGNGMLVSLPMMLGLCNNDPIGAIHSVATSAYIQGFLIALATVFESGGNKDA